MSKSLFPFLATAVFLFGAGYWVGRNSAPETEQLARFQHSIEEIDTVDLKEYHSLKGQSEKLKKADEILEKVMSAFLAELGQRYKRVDRTPAPALPKAPEPAQEKSPEVAVETPSQPTPDLKPAAPAPAGASANAFSSPFQNAELERDGTNDFLKHHLRSDFGALLSQSFRPEKGDPLFLELNGKYSGVVQLFNPTETWTLTFELKGKPNASAYSGNASARLMKGSKTISWRNEKTSISMLRKSSPGSQWLVLEISEFYYAELFFQESNRSFVGNFYVKKGPNQFVHRGNVVLSATE